MRGRGMLLGSSSFALVAFGVSTLAVAQRVPPQPGPPPPPPVIAAPHAGSVRAAPMERQALIVWQAGEAQCGNAPVRAVRPPNPLPGMGWSRAGADKPIRFTFRLDASGRPLGIKAEPEALLFEGQDLAPSLAASRFAPGVREGCTVSFQATRQPIDTVPVELAMAYTIFPTSGTRSPALWDRVRSAGGTCLQTRLQVLNRAYPDFPALPGEEGRPLWSMVAFDIGKAGKPVNVHTAAGSRSAPLDAASRRAVSQSRFGREARTGCLYPYRKAADPLTAPEMPARETFPANSAACEATGGWVRKPRLVYPSNYSRRRIEGWAVIAFDVAPWGAVGNARVLAAEPSDDFGRAGLSTVQTGGKAPSTSGASGCIERVRFVVRSPDAPIPTEPDASVY